MINTSELYACAHWTLHQHSDNNPPDDSCLEDFLRSVALYGERRGYMVQIIGPHEEHCDGETAEHWDNGAGECGYCAGTFIKGFDG